jgi:hypothetical protein
MIPDRATATLKPQGFCQTARLRKQETRSQAPATAFGPAIEAIVDGCIGTILGRAIAPAGAALEDMDDATDDPPTVISFGSGQAARQMRMPTACH